MARAAKRHGKKRGTGQRLTAKLQGGLVGSGARRSGRIDGEGRWGRSLKTMAMAAARGPSGRVRRRGGRGRNSGALGGVGEARRWLWPRERWSAATASIRSREAKQRSEGDGGPESEGEVRGGRGLRGVVGGTREGGGSQAGRRWPPRPRACEHATAPTGKRKTTGGGGLGRAGPVLLATR